MPNRIDHTKPTIEVPAPQFDLYEFLTMSEETADRFVSLSIWLTKSSLLLYCVICDVILLSEIFKGLCFVWGIPFGVSFSSQSLFFALIGSIFISWVQVLLKDALDISPRFYLLNLYPRFEFAVRHLFSFWLKNNKNYRVLQPLCGRGWCGENWAFMLANDISKYHWADLWLPRRRRQTLQHIHYVLGVVERSRLNYESVRNYLASIDIPLAQESISNQSINLCPLGIVCETMTGQPPSCCPNQHTCRFYFTSY